MNHRAINRDDRLTVLTVSILALLCAAGSPSRAVTPDDTAYDKRHQGPFDRAIRLKPALAEVHEYIGDAYAEMADFEMPGKHPRILNDLEAAEAGELEAFIREQKATS